MTSAHGNKTMAASAGVCLTAAALLFGGTLSEKKVKLRLYEKKYSEVASALQQHNQQLLNSVEKEVE